MDVKILQKFLLVNASICSLIFLGSNAFSINSTEKGGIESINRKQKITVLITSSEGMQFAKENNEDGTISIIYDCSIGLTDVGTIYATDNFHPKSMSSLRIQNCHNITLRIKYSDFTEYCNFKNLIIENVTSLSYYMMNSYNGGYYHSYDDRWSLPTCFPSLPDEDGNKILISISNCKILTVYNKDSHQFNVKRNIHLVLQNVILIKTLQRLTFLSESSLHLKNVKIDHVQKEAISLTSTNTSVLIVENSYFGHVEAGAFRFKGSLVKLLNNTFRNLEENAFLINATNSFIFSENLVQKMDNPFYVKSPRVDIFRNTFVSSEASWLSKIGALRDYGDYDDLRVLNVTENTIKNFPSLFFDITVDNVPDFFYFTNNSFVCSCRYVNLVKYGSFDFIKNVFLHKNNKNVCVNLGNCPLQNAVYNMDALCSGNFKCLEYDENDKNLMQLRSILSVLERIDSKLTSFMVKHNSSLDERNELTTKESDTVGLIP